MSKSSAHERNQKVFRNRLNPIKKWSPSEEMALINYIKQNRDFERPTCRIYYSKFLTANKIDSDWILVRSKVRNMRTAYRRAKEYEINQNYFNSSSANIVRDKVLQKCWYLDHFDVLFPNDMDNIIKQTPEKPQIDKKCIKEENELTSTSLSSNSIDDDIFRVQKDIFNLKRQKHKRHSSIREQELELAREKLAFDKEKLRQEIKIKEMEIASQEKIMLMELHMKERIALKQLELEEKLALDSMEVEETSYGNEYHNMT